MNSRKKSEKRIHNEFFSKDTRKKLSLFYSITEKSTSFYDDLLVNNCFNKKVLDYGCGKGDEVFFLAKYSSEIFGIDISEEGIKQALKKLEEEPESIKRKINFLVMDGEKMTFKDNSFDIVCGTGILHHLNLDSSLKEIRRVLKPTGKAIFFEPLGHNPVLNIFRRFTPNLRTPDEHPLLMRDIKKAYNYFNKVNIHFFHFFSLLAVPFKNTKIFNPLLNNLEKIDKNFFKFFPFVKLMAWIIVIEFSQPK